LPGIGSRLTIAAGHKRRKHPQSVIVVFEQLGQALGELAYVLFRRPVPIRISFAPSFVELEVYSEIDSRLGGVANLLVTRTAIWRIRFCIDVWSILQRRRQELCKSTCMLRLVHGPPPRDARTASLICKEHAQARPDTSPWVVWHAWTHRWPQTMMVRG
jgi:hypothetical protein